MRIILIAITLVMAGLIAGQAAASNVDWQAAIGTLAGERTRAETCVRIFKRHAGEDPAAISQGELAYANAKADVDAVIASLSVGLAEGKPAEEFDSLGTRLEKGVRIRQAFCDDVKKLIPEDDGKTKGVFESIGAIGDVLVAVIGAAKDIYFAYREDDKLERKTIQTQLEATRWSDFGAIGE